MQETKGAAPLGNGPRQGEQGDSNTDSADGTVSGDYWPLVPDSDYSAVITGHETAMIFSRPKLYVHLRIVSPGPFFGRRVFRAYRVHRLKGRPRKNGRFEVRPGSELYRMVCRLDPSPHRPDRISLRSLKGVVLRIKTRTVKQDANQRALPEKLRYSVVDDILSVEEGDL